ncbi:hypothetical protein O9X81_00325 [Agrobacterium salinitolerans]|uniref:hypothetical protein n=1 Tax=Agrobacterium salinitolerans TaxID=1183413 RepID=UPI0022B8189E|nr:hypothetical protein [Agrobacterium salinitolerans]MCZ7855053.1 hypothetical protein [Agrobacterium salinitolerans]
MTKIVNSSEYSTNAIFVGCSVNEDGEPLVEINGKAIGTVAGLLDFLGKYQGQQKATVNVKWAASAAPDGSLGPNRYKLAPAHRSTAFFVDVPAALEHKPFVVRDGVLHINDIEVKDAYTGGLSVGTANIEGADKDAVARLQRELDDLKDSLPRRVEEAIKSASIRNVRHHL